MQDLSTAPTSSRGGCSRDKLFCADSDGPEIIGAAPTLRRILSNVKTVAATDAAVLILGETAPEKNSSPVPSTI